MSLPGVAPVNPRAWIVPIVMNAVVGISISLTQPLFALLLEAKALPGHLIGLNSLGSAIAMVLGAAIMPVVLMRIGLIPLIVASVFVLVGTMALAPLWSDIWFWFVLRALWGLGVVAMFFVSEYWIVAVAPHGARGRVLAVYAIVMSGSFIVGPEILRLVGIDGWRPFLAVIGITLCSLPFALRGRLWAPNAYTQEPAGWTSALRLFYRDPVLMLSPVFFGILEFGAMALISVWGVRAGLSETAALTVLSRIALGAMLIQLPLGWAIDRWDPYRILLISMLILTVTPFFMVWNVLNMPVLIGAAMLWGGMASAPYLIALNTLGARYHKHGLSAVNAAIVLAYGLGALVGPGAMGAAMDFIPPHGLLWLSAGLAGGYAVLICIYLGLARAKTLDRISQTGR